MQASQGFCALFRGPQVGGLEGVGVAGPDISESSAREYAAGPLVTEQYRQPGLEC